MTDTASLIIKVDSSGADRATRSLDKLDRAAGGTERAANKLGKAWGIALGIVSSAVIAGATREYIRASDAMANMGAKLKLVAGSAEGAAKAQRALFDLSQRTSSDLEATTDLYVKLGQSNKDLAANSELLLGITEKVSKALVISGADAASSAAVIRQFSQAMGAGALRGDEFISVMEGAPRLAQAIADGLGKPIGALRDLAAEGKLTSETIIKALENQGATLDREFGEMPLTVGRATQQVRNALTQLIGDTDKASGASADLAQAIADMARVLESEETKQGFAAIVNGIASIVGAIGDAIPWIVKFNEKLSEGLGADRKNGNAWDFVKGNIDFYKSALKGDFNSDANARIRSGFNGTPLPEAQYTGEGLPSYFKLGDIGQKPFSAISKPFSAIGDMPAKATAAATEEIKKKTVATRELTEAEKAWLEFEKDLAALQEESAESSREYALDQIKAAQDKQDAIERGRAATDGLIKDMEFELHLLGLSNVEREKAIALRYADANATDEQKAKIAELAEAYVKASDAMEYQIGILDGARDATRGLFDDLREGVGIWDALTNAAGRFADRLFEMASDSLIDQFFGKMGSNGAGTTGGGWLSALFGGASGGTGNTNALADLFGFASNGFGFDGGGYTGAGGRKQPAGIVHRGEVVWSQDDVARAGGVGRVEAMRRGGRVGGRQFNQTFITNIQGRLDRSTEAQLARRQGREAQIAMARS